MSKAFFQAKVTLQNVIPLNGEMTEWLCDTTFNDADGAFTGYDITIGDMLAVDTGNVEAGSFTFFEVFDITQPGATTSIFSVRYSSVNDNTNGAPDLAASMFQDCTIARPSTKLGLLPVVSTNLQQVNDKFTEYVQNYNFVKIVDELQSGNRTFAKINGSTSPLLKGMAVYITETNDTECEESIATSYEASCVVGLVADAVVPPGVSGEISSKGMIEKSASAWDIITGETGGLRGGKDYFLRHDMAGGITSIPPTASTQFVVKVGKAISSTLLDINIEPPIQL
jgi:hypothetical protein